MDRRCETASASTSRQPPLQLHTHIAPAALRLVALAPCRQEGDSREQPHQWQRRQLSRKVVHPGAAAAAFASCSRSHSRPHPWGCSLHRIHCRTCRVQAYVCVWVGGWEGGNAGTEGPASVGMQLLQGSHAIRQQAAAEGGRPLAVAVEEGGKWQAMPLRPLSGSQGPLPTRKTASRTRTGGTWATARRPDSPPPSTRSTSSTSRLQGAKHEWAQWVGAVGGWGWEVRAGWRGTGGQRSQHRLQTLRS